MAKPHNWLGPQQRMKPEAHDLHDPTRLPEVDVFAKAVNEAARAIGGLGEALQASPLLDKQGVNKKGGDVMHWHFIPLRMLQDGTIIDNQFLEKHGLDGVVVRMDFQNPESGEVGIALLCDEKQASDMLAGLGFLRRAKWEFIYPRAEGWNRTPIRVLEEATPRQRGADAPAPAAPFKMPEVNHAQEYVRLVSVREKDLKTKLQKTLATAREKTRSLTEELTTTYEVVHKSEIELTQVDTTRADKLLEEFNSLAEMGMVKQVEIVGNLLAVRTEVLSILPDNVELGEFTIKIDLKEGRIASIVNKTPVHLGGDQIGQHPYVHGATGMGYICWGNAGGAVADLQAKREFPSLIMLVINFLQSFRGHRDNGGYARYYKAFVKRGEDKKREERKKEKVEEATPKINFGENGGKPKQQRKKRSDFGKKKGPRDKANAIVKAVEEQLVAGRR